MSEAPALVLLAAGIGRRFGGLKQLAPIGPNGEAILDLTISDAAAADFGSAVLIIRHEIEDEMRAHLEGRSALPVKWAFQDDLTPTRPKPWGTAHALLSAAPLLDGAFGVVNADDYYDVDGIAQLGGWLRERRRANAACIVAYRLGDTLSAEGTVSRGICDVDGDGHLVRLVEHLKIAVGDGDVIRSEHGPLADDAAASMNLFGLDRSVLDAVADAWDEWISRKRDDAEDECRLPEVLNDLVSSAHATIDVLHTDATWIGITYPADVEPTRAALAHRFGSDGFS